MSARRCAAVVLLALASCNTESHWKRASAPVHTAGPGGSALDVPAGWVYQLDGERMFLSRDNPALHHITLALLPHVKKDDRTTDPTQSPAELAEHVIADIKSSGNWSHVEVLENAPATVAGLPGCRLHMRLDAREQKQAVTESLDYLVGTGPGVYQLTYLAWAGQHFERDLPLFEALAKSFRLDAAAAVTQR